MYREIGAVPSMLFYFYFDLFQFLVLTPKEDTKGRAPMAVPGNLAVIWMVGA